MDKVLLIIVLIALFGYVTYEVIRGNAGRKR